MKKILALLLALCMVFAFAACGSEPAAESDAPSESTAPAAESEAPATGDNVISIGVFEPLTGASGAGGRQEYLGMQYAQSLQRGRQPRARHLRLQRRHRRGPVL